MPRKTVDLDQWYARARHKYIWDNQTIEAYIEVLKEVVHHLIEELDADEIYLENLASPQIGIFRVSDQGSQSETRGYALYVAHVRTSHDRRRTLLGEFKMFYEASVGRGLAEDMLRDDDLIRQMFPKEQAERILRRKYERRRLVGNFMRLANKSINRRRAISPRLRYQVLNRDHFTCQNCGRKAPEVILHIDHIAPVSWGIDWRPSNDPDAYQTLCEECNLGKGDLSWMFEL
jgi:hypothetical protein